jgi:hypothetical protein
MRWVLSTHTGDGVSSAVNTEKFIQNKDNCTRNEGLNKPLILMNVIIV